MPTRNRSRDLRQGLQNALSQTGVELELIVSDNASSDETEAICREVAKTDSRLRFFRHNSTLGLYEHHNFCLEKAEGEFLAFFHDHDLHHSDFVRRCLDLMQNHTRVGLVGADWRMENEEGLVLGERRARVPVVENGWSYIQRTIRSGRSSVAIPGAVMRRAAVGVHRLGGAKGFGDFPLWFRIAEDWNIGHLKEVSWTMRQSVDAQSATTILQMSRDYLENIGSYLSDLEKRRVDLREWIDQRRKEANKFVYWSLLYEWLLDARPHPNKSAQRTLFEMYGYRLTEGQKRDLEARLIQFSPPLLAGFTRMLLSAGASSRVSLLFTRLINYPDLFRKLLKLH